MSSIVISGTSGFIGSHLAKHFLSSGDKVFGLSRHNNNFFQHPNYNWIQSDTSLEEDEGKLLTGFIAEELYELLEYKTKDANSIQEERLWKMFQSFLVRSNRLPADVIPFSPELRGPDVIKE